MRALTEAEARVIATLLSSSAEEERGRLRSSGLARSTFHDVRRRVYGEGWVRDRYFPHPAFYGLTRATFVLGRPFADRVDALVARWQTEPLAPVVWASPQVALGVFLFANDRAAVSARPRINDPELVQNPFVVTVDLAQLSVPVFFDYEGGWTHMAGVQGSGGYPRGIGGALAPGTHLPARWEWAMEEILRRPEAGPSQGMGPHLLGPDRLPHSQRNLLDLGWASYRVIPDFGRLPPYQGRAADLAVFVTGEWVEPGPEAALLTALTEKSRVFPFLLVLGETGALIGTVAQSPAADGGSPSTDPYRQPVLPTLQRHLRNIQVISENAGVLHAWNDLAGSVFIGARTSARARK
jgi:hypothetical protein